MRNKRQSSDSQTLSKKPTGWVSGLTRKRLPGPSLEDKDYGFINGNSTLSVHAGTHDDTRSGMVGTPIYQGSTFILGETQYNSVFKGYPRDELIYSRYGNPSQWAVQEKIAALENAESALVFSSGMAAIAATLFGLLDKGGHVVASNELYGGTYNLLLHEFPNCGMSATLVDPKDLSAIEAAIKPETQILYFEALTNPLLKLADLPEIAKIAKRHNLRLVVDAAFVTPLGMNCLEMGVDVVLHSCSKYLNGHSDLIAGAAAGTRKLMDMIWSKLLHFGGSLDPHACFLLERGMKTLSIRMKAHETGALKLAKWLEQQNEINQVFHIRLPSHPDFELANQLLKNGTGMICFEIKGGDTAALKLLSKLKLAKEATSLGGVETLISLPYNTSQEGYTSNQRKSLGINSGCIRLSVGIEDPQDLIADFAQAIATL